LPGAALLRNIALLLGLLALFALPGPSARAADLTGTVVGPNGIGVPGVDIDVNDSVTGDSIPISNDTTDANGMFTVAVPDNATYDVSLSAPLATRLVSRIVPGVVVTTGTTNLGVLPLEPGALLTGQIVRLANGTPVVNVDTDIDRSATGERVFTPGDNTDANGIFQVIAPLEPVDFTVEPGVPLRLVGLLLEGIPIAGDTNLGALPLEPGALLTGAVVRASDGTPVAGADTDLSDAATGAPIPTAADDTDAGGIFAVVAPLRPVDLVVEPLKADRLVAREIPDIAIVGDTNVGAIAVDAGALLTALVLRTSNGTPVVGADTDVEDAFTGVSIPTAGDNTDAAGIFSVVVPFGTVSVTVEPRKADRLVAYRNVDVPIAGDTNLGLVSLPPGFLVSGTVSGPGGPAAGVAASAFDATTGARVHIPDSRSAPDGSYAFVLPAGVFDMKWSSPLEQGTARLLVPNFGVGGDTVFHPTLAASAGSVSIGDTGHLALAGQSFVPVVSFRNNTGAPLLIRGALLGELPRAGIVKPVFPPVDKVVPAVSRVLAKSVQLPIPANFKPQLRGVALYVRIQVLDPGTQALIDEDFFDFEVR